jgi:hypothetical protein
MPSSAIVIPPVEYQPEMIKGSHAQFAPKKEDIKQQLDRLFSAESADEHPLEKAIEDEPKLEPDVQRLADYIESKGQIAVRAIKQNWGKNNGFVSSQIDDFLIELMGLSLVETFTPEGRREEWVKWAI